MAEVTMRFTTKKELMMLPPPQGKDKYYEWYKHATQPGLYVRVSKEDAHGKIERQYFHRYKVEKLGQASESKKVEKRDPIGYVDEIRLEDALRKVLEKRRALHQELGSDTSLRLTVGGAWAFYDTEKYKNSATTKGKEQDLYRRYLSHLKDRFLDELPYAFWAEYLKQLREGTLLVGTRESANGGTVPAILGPLANASLIGVMNTASILYEIGNKYSGLQGQVKGKNPPAEVRKGIGEPNKKKKHIPLKDLGIAWRASEQLISPWWRDMFRVFVLTGLRRSLLMGMKFNEIDFERGLYIIDPRKPGAKRKAEKITQETPYIRLPLSRFVVDTIRARREFAPDKDGLVWYTPKPTRGRRTKSEKQSITDPRTAWTLIEWAIGGLHFSPHDLRRTFASAGAAATIDMFAVSMLMLHTGEELAKAANVPGITIQYIDTDEAVERMRQAAEEITDYVLNLAKLPAGKTKNIVDPVLPKNIEDDLNDIRESV